jgi:hypothetical protein
LDGAESTKKSWKTTKNQKYRVKIIGRIDIQPSKTDKKQKNSEKIGIETSKSA